MPSHHEYEPLDPLAGDDCDLPRQYFANESSRKNRATFNRCTLWVVVVESVMLFALLLAFIHLRSAWPLCNQLLYCKSFSTRSDTFLDRCGSERPVNHEC